MVTDPHSSAPAAISNLKRILFILCSVNCMKVGMLQSTSLKTYDHERKLRYLRCINSMQIKFSKFHPHGSLLSSFTLHLNIMIIYRQKMFNLISEGERLDRCMNLTKLPKYHRLPHLPYSLMNDAKYFMSYAKIF